uniref:Uncharacterized protein n=1 Tax=Anguilla anguilla TaxID=7936 RepID=A0A0E9X5W3_ANGAN
MLNSIRLMVLSLCQMDVDPCSDIVYCIVINIPSSGYSSCSGNGIARNNTDVLKVFSLSFLHV